VVILGVVGHKPLKPAKRRALAVADDVVELLTILGDLKKLGQTRQK
jgi:hypothetical protein